MYPAKLAEIVLEVPDPVIMMFEPALRVSNFEAKSVANAVVSVYEASTFVRAVLVT